MPGKVLDGVVDLPVEGLANLHRQGLVAGTMRYTGPRAWSWPKIVTRDRYQGAYDAGVPQALNYETTGATWRQGRAGGRTDGVAAMTGAHEVGHPHHLPVFFSADTPIGPADLPLWGEYALGVNEGAGFTQGFYVDAVGIDYLVMRGLGVVFWQPNARGWPGDAVDDPRAALVQRTSHSFPPFPPGLYDESDVQHAYWAQNDPGASPAPPPAPGLMVEEDFMLINPRSKNQFRPETVELDARPGSRALILRGGAELAGYPGKTIIPVPTSGRNIQGWDKHVDGLGATVVDDLGHGFVYRLVIHK